MKIWEEVVLPALYKILTDALSIVPHAVGAIVILLIGWVIARVFNALVSRLLGRLGFNSLAERAGITELLRDAGFNREPSWVVGKLIFWLLMLTFFLSAAQQMNLPGLAAMLQKVVAFIPNLIAVVLIGVAGALFARFAGGLVRGAAREVGIDFADFLGKLITAMILVMVVVMAFTQLEIRSSMLELTFSILLGACGLGIALMLGMGSRTIAQNIIAGLYARRAFRPGQQVEVQKVRGELIEVGTVSVSIRTADDTLVMLPNTLLIDTVTERKNLEAEG